MVKYVLMTPWCCPKILEWYNVMILSTQCSGIAKTAYSFLDIVVILNNNESSNKYLSANVSVLLLAALEYGILFYAKYKIHPWNMDCLNIQPGSPLL